MAPRLDIRRWAAESALRDDARRAILVQRRNGGKDDGLGLAANAAPAPFAASGERVQAGAYRSQSLAAAASIRPIDNESSITAFQSAKAIVATSANASIASSAGSTSACAVATSAIASISFSGSTSAGAVATSAIASITLSAVATAVATSAAAASRPRAVG